VAVVVTRTRAVSALLVAVAVGTVAYDATALPSPWGVTAALLCAARAVVVGACLATIARTD
jgi:hypothetical protein